jgi:outer membrane protein OmpA-like peptidoglycan-associated protein
MTFRTMRRWRSAVGASRAGRERHRLTAATLTLLALLGAGPVAAQRSNVDVDLGALDTLGPPDASSTQRLRLRPPQSASPKRPAPVPQAAATPPATRPAPPPPQATAVPAPARPTTEPPPVQQAKAPPSPQAAAAPAPVRPTTEPPPVQDAKAPPPVVLPPPPVGAAAKPTPPVAEPAPRDPTSQTAGTVADRIIFPADAIVLPDAAKEELDNLAKRLAGDARLYVQIVAYAGNDADASAARRTSLSRALAARSYLVGQGVAIKQVDVRPLGNRSEAGLPPDRVDLVVAER